MLAENPFLRIESPSGSNESLRSAIVNSICPACGGALSLSSQQFQCQGRCGTDWRPMWNRILEPEIAGANRFDQVGKGKGSVEDLAFC